MYCQELEGHSWVNTLPARLLWFTGGAAGIGQVTAERLLPPGRQSGCGLGYQSGRRRKPLFRRIKAGGGEAVFVPANVARQMRSKPDGCRDRFITPSGLRISTTPVSRLTGTKAGRRNEDVFRPDHGDVNVKGGLAVCMRFEIP